MRAGLPTRAANRAGSARGAIERTLLGLQKKSTGKVAPYLREGDVEVEKLKKSSPDAIRKILEYLAQDYACLGYPVPAV